MKFSDFKTPEDLKKYLEKPFHHTTRSVFHYTNLNALVQIFNGKKLKASTFEKTNDILEEDFLIEEVKQKKFMCFMKTRIDNYGMWAMYGGLKNEKGENPKLEDFCVKIEFPVDMLKKFIKNHNLKANLIAYTDFDSDRNEKIYFCGTVTNSQNINLDKELLSGYVKDVIWKNEEELRIWFNNDFEEIDDEFLSSLKIIPNPLYTVEDYKKILRQNNVSEELINKMNFEKNIYYNTYRPK